MRPVPYQLHRGSRRLALRATIHLCLTGAAAAAIGFLAPRADSADGDTSTAVTLLIAFASFLIWCAVVLSTLTVVLLVFVETWAQIAGVERPGPPSRSNEPR
jgi:hypothetical protein